MPCNKFDIVIWIDANVQHSLWPRSCTFFEVLLRERVCVCVWARSHVEMETSSCASKRSTDEMRTYDSSVMQRVYLACHGSSYDRRCPWLCVRHCQVVWLSCLLFSSTLFWPWLTTPPKHVPWTLRNRTFQLMHHKFPLRLAAQPVQMN